MFIIQRYLIENQWYKLLSIYSLIGFISGFVYITCDIMFIERDMSDSFNAYYMLGSICWFSAAFFFYNIQCNYGTKSSLKTALFFTGTSLTLTALLSHFPTILFVEMIFTSYKPYFCHHKFCYILVLC